MKLTPRGCANIGGDLAARMERCRNETLGLFLSYGYRPFSPAEFQLLESTWDHLSKQRRSKVITMNSPFGDACCLRADLTLSAVAYLCAHFAPNERPLRLCYADRVFSAPTPPHENLEMNQVGVELLGWEGEGADLEVITLAMNALDNLGIKESVLVLGDTSVASELFSSLPPALSSELVEALQAGQYVAYEKALSQWETTDEKMRVLKELPYMKGGEEILERAGSILGKGPELPLSKLVKMLGRLGYGGRIRIDLGFIRDLGYYSGPVFNLYSSPNGVLLGGGGRYDGLLSEMNMTGQAMGFGLNLRELSLCCKHNGTETNTLVWAGKSSPADAMEYAWKLQSMNIPFELSWHADMAASRELSLIRGYRWWLDMNALTATEVKSGEKTSLAEYESKAKKESPSC